MLGGAVAMAIRTLPAVLSGPAVSKEKKKNKKKVLKKTRIELQSIQ